MNLACLFVNVFSLLLINECCEQNVIVTVICVKDVC